MSDRARELASKRAALQARCAAQRAELAELGSVLEMRLARVDRAVAIVRRILSAPVLVGVALAVGLFLGPRRLFRWAGRAMMFASTARRLVRS